jgi:ankyrin repeat protein
LLTFLIRFRWVVCQLDALRECLARNVLQVLEELPDTLDETYDRILRGIKKSNRKDVYRLLQCLVVSMRPLRVEELAEILALDFDGDEEIPKLNPEWRWEDEEEALQAACSSLISIVDTDGSRVVQFSHFSVKEYLTSPRLEESSGDVSCYHIFLGPAHIILACACLGVLLRLDYGAGRKGTMKRLPLAEYAAEHWADHAQFENVSSSLRKGMEELFDEDKPHFEAWCRLQKAVILPNVDIFPSTSPTIYFFPDLSRSGTPLLYAALYGFHDLAKHLIDKHPEHVDRRGGEPATPLMAALVQGYLQVAELLYRHGANVNVRGWMNMTPFLFATLRGNLEAMRWLLSHGADRNARGDHGELALHIAARFGHPEVIRMLLDQNADINARSDDGLTALHLASRSGYIDVVRLLLDRGADVDVQDYQNCTPLHLASREGILEVVRALLAHGADVRVMDAEGSTAFDVASSKGYDNVARLLSDHDTS